MCRRIATQTGACDFRRSADYRTVPIIGPFEPLELCKLSVGVKADRMRILGANGLPIPKSVVLPAYMAKIFIDLLPAITELLLNFGGM